MNRTLEHILPRVQKPARYTGGEYNAVVKDRRAVDVRYALCFPDTYEIGMSNLGVRILYGTEADVLDTEGTLGLRSDILEEMDMKRLVEQTLGDMADQIEESGFAIRYQCEATHTRFIGDSSRMYRVVQNVIENALKYSLKGTRIFLRITEADQNIKLEVINTASYEMNFTEEEIMERFARAEKSRTSEGNGLGLSIADSFTKNCGGEFSIRIDGDQFLVTIQFKQHLDVNK